MIHELKCWPEYFDQVQMGRKKFEVRKNDREFKQYDLLVLREWNPDLQEYTGNQVTRTVTYILPGGKLGIEEGYVVMSLR